MQRLGRHVVGPDTASGDGAGKLAGGVRDLLAAAVRQREGERHLLVVLGLAPQRIEHGAHQGGQAPEVADGVEADAVVEDLAALREQEVAQQQHERVDLVLWTGPVLFTERVEGQGPQAQATCGTHDAAHGRGAFAMTLGAGLTAKLGPAAVAIHDDADVPGKIAGFDQSHCVVAR
jgi:hypothetical protein